MTNNEIRAFLAAHAECEFGRFTSALIPGAHRMWGVRLPLLHELAARLARGDWRAYLAQASNDSVEEVMLQGFVLGAAKMPVEEALERLAHYVPKIDNWAVCDSPVTALRFVKKHREDVWPFVLPYLDSEREFEQRFGVVMLLSHFVTPEYIDQILVRLRSLTPKGYYARMGTAWALQVCLVKFPALTMEALRGPVADVETHNLALRKMQESRRTPPELRHELRAMKR